MPNGTVTLFDYLRQTQRFTREARQDFINPEDMLDYINRARREVAMRAQCIRVLTPISGSCVSVVVTAPGAGYTVAPTVTISAPDFPSGGLPDPLGAQATASVILSGTSIAAIDVTYGGYGYFQPTITIEGGGGSGAEATVEISPINQLNPGQESYSFNDIDVSIFPGVDHVYMIRSVSVIYSNYRYSLPMYAFSVYQAMIRNYPYQYSYVPSVASQYGQGTNGSFYAYPLPSQLYQWEFDCFCLPQDMVDNHSFEAIPMPWTEAVSYFAAHLCYLELQNLNAANYYLDLFDKFVLRYSNYARPGRTINPYGRY